MGSHCADVGSRPGALANSSVLPVSSLQDTSTDRGGGLPLRAGFGLIPSLIFPYEINFAVLRIDY